MDTQDQNVDIDMKTFKEYLNEVKYYQQKDVYIHIDGGFPVEVIKWDNPYQVPNGAIITIRDMQGAEHVYGEEEFDHTFRKKEE